MGHFSIDADPDAIEQAGNGLVELGTNLESRSGEVRGYIGGLGPQQWSGAARTAISQEAEGLANQLHKFAPMFGNGGQALKTLAGKIRTAEDTTIPSLNSRWEGAQTTYNDAVSKANTAYSQNLGEINRDAETQPQLKKVLRQDAVDVRNYAHSEAYDARTRTQNTLTGEFEQLVRDLEQACKTASESLTQNCLIAVPDETVSAFVAGRGSGAMPSWTTPDGKTFPPELGAQKATKLDLKLLDQRDQVLDGEKVAQALDDWNSDGKVPPPPLPPEVEALTKEHKDDPYFGQTVATTLGPQKIVEIMQKAKGLTGPDEPHYAVDDESAELDRLRGIQDQLATTLGVSLAAGSRAPGGLPGYAKTIIEKDARVAGYLFKYADQQGVAFSGEFTHEAGKELVAIEGQDPAIWQQRYDNDLYTFGNTDSFEDDKDPMLWFLRAADNSVDSAQGLMGDRDLMKYLMNDQPDWDGRDDQAGNILRVATIEAARLPVPEGTDPQDSQAWKAAQIASNALDVAGEGGKPHDGVKEELGGILALYMPDVDRAFANPDGGPGVYDHTKEGWPKGVKPEDGWPQFGIQMTDEDLRDVLGDIGGNDTATNLVGKSATAYNQVRLTRGAEESVGWTGPGNRSPFEIAGSDSATLQGFLVDGMARGRIDDAADLEKERKRIATAFLLPVSLASNALPAGGQAAAPLVDAVIGKISDEIADGAKGDSVKLAYEEANTSWDQTRQTLKMQVLIAAYQTDQVPPEVTWPVDETTGLKKTPDQLTDQEKREMLQDFRGAGGFAGDAMSGVETGQDAYQSKFAEPPG
jgi:hypothetical protein